jgi:hypothetical protein
MAKKKETTLIAPKPNDGWVYTTEIEANGRVIVPGTELQIAGERGRFVFSKQVDTGKVIWIDVRSKDGIARSFYPEQIKTVHVKKKTNENLAKAYKAKKASLKA